MLKKMIAIVVGSLVGFSLAASAWAEGEERYQLFQGRYLHHDGAQGTSAEMNDLFFIDTVTGDVSIFMSTSDNEGKRVRYWEPALLDETKGAFGN